MGGLPWMKRRMLWMLWMMTTISLNLPVATGIPVFEEFYPLYAIPQKNVTTLITNAPSLDEVECSFTDHQLRIGHLEDNGQAQTILVSSEEPVQCKMPYMNVRGVGCVKLVRALTARVPSHTICEEEGNTLFTADTPQHLQRLHDNFLSLTKVSSGFVWVRTIDGRWLAGSRSRRSLVTRRPVAEEETDTTPITGFAAMNPDNGRLRAFIGMEEFSFVCQMVLD